MTNEDLSYDTDYSEVTDVKVRSILRDLGLLSGEGCIVSTNYEKREILEDAVSRLYDLECSDDFIEKVSTEFNELCWSNSDFNEYYTGDPTDFGWQDYTDF